eukprot:Skav221528  [mRNA]  locus=scaffold1248:283612:287211:- [translate_table: standard]
MDQATRYIALRLMKSEKSVDLVKGIERGWIKHFSVPKYLRIDEGKGFAAQHLRDWCSDHNIILEIAPAEAHNWIGSIERKHQVIRRSLELYMEDRGARDRKTLLEAAIYCPGQINSLSYTRGFTPTQWVLGRSASDSFSLTSSIFNPGLSPMNDPLDFNQVQSKRLAAQTAFLKADSDARLRRAMLQNYRKVKQQVVVGQRCYYWRIQRSGILQKNKWRGPARCVAEERDDDGKQLILWLCHGTSLIRCSPHQVRPGVTDAGMDRPVDLQAALKDLKDLRARSTTQFRDVVSDEPSFEDLMDDDEMNDYEPSIAPDDPGDDNGDDPGSPPSKRPRTQDELPGAMLMYQRAQSDQGMMSPRSIASPGTDVPECPPPDEDDDKRSHEATSEISQPSIKRARAAADVPVPDDDELIVEDAHMVEIAQSELPKEWHLIDGDFELDETYLAEVSERHMSLEDKEKVIQAKQQELQTYFQNQVWEFTQLGHDQGDRVVTARWVIVWKPGSDGSLQRRAKARLVLRGYQDPDVFNLEKTSPTANKNSKMILLAFTPILGWTIFCGDVRAAFLSGAKFDRVIIVRLPSDCSAMLGCKGPTHMRMKKSAYGLSDAPLLWWTEADRRLRQLKLVRHRLDKCMYMMYNTSGKLIGVVILHVDDLLLSMDMNDEEAQPFIDKLKKAFDFGKWQCLSEKQDIVYCGGRIQQQKDQVSLDFEAYMKKMMPITVEKGRNSQETLTPKEVSKARALIGALQWPAGQGCPFLSASTSINAANINKATVELLHDLNKTLRFGKQSADFRINMRKVCDGLDDLCFLCYSDAAFNVRSNGSSQGGFIVVLTSKRVLKGEKVGYSILSWRSFKLNRVCRSSLSAESQACATALDELMMVKTMVALMLDPKADPTLPDTAASCGDSAIVIDAKALYDSLKKEGIGSAADKRAGIEILCIKEEIQRLRTSLRWVSSERMLADGMTKISARQNLVTMLRSGYLSLVQDEEYVAAKKKDKQTRHESTARTFGYSSAVASRIAAVVAMGVMTTGAQADHVNEENEVTDYVLMIAVIVMIIGVVSVIFFMCRAVVIWWKLSCKKHETQEYVQFCERRICRLEKELTDAREAREHAETEGRAMSEALERNKMKYNSELSQRTSWMNSQLCRGPLFIPQCGNKAHLREDCPTLRSKLTPSQVDGVCQFCWNALVDEAFHRHPNPMVPR